jgi:anti-sigma B factor antagonist
MAGEQAVLQVERVATAEIGTAVFRVAGDLDLSTVDRLRAAVGPTCGTEQEVRIDLTDLKFCDSTGVGAFVWLYRQLSASGGRLVLYAPRGHVRDVLRISGVDRVIPILSGTAVQPGGPGESASGQDGAPGRDSGAGKPAAPRRGQRNSHRRVAGGGAPGAGQRRSEGSGGGTGVPPESGPVPEGTPDPAG